MITVLSFPQSFIKTLSAQLGSEYDAFEAALQQAAPVSIRHNSAKVAASSFEDPILWCNEGQYLQNRPVFTLDPLFHAGAYYVQEASSMLIGHALAQVADLTQPLRVLDLCAAPGGKTTLLASLLHPDSLLLANEVIKSRVSILKENIQKWGLPQVHVSNHDPQSLGGLDDFFDIIVIDAPCSGEGLFRKDPAAINEWSPDSVQMCAGRQKRILSAALPLLKSGGILVYCTCTYNDTENQENAQFVIETGEFEELKITLPTEWGVWAKTYGYQCYPHRVKGEGFFFSVFQKKEPVFDPEAKYFAKKGRDYRFRSFKALLPRETTEVKRWLARPDDFHFFIKPNDEIIAVLDSQLEDLKIIDNILFAKGLGLEMGVFKGKDFIPSHALALSVELAEELPRIELSESEALQFLKKENFPLEAPKGWLLATYQGLGLGWMKSLGNRFNNYLPKDWRIRMEIPE